MALSTQAIAISTVECTASLLSSATKRTRLRVLLEMLLAQKIDIFFGRARQLLLTEHTDVRNQSGIKD